jgi:hypothetical protein
LQPDLGSAAQLERPFCAAAAPILKTRTPKAATNAAAHGVLFPKIELLLRIIFTSFRRVSVPCQRPLDAFRINGATNSINSLRFTETNLSRTTPPASTT